MSRPASRTILEKIDLMAVLVCLLGLCLLGVSAAVFAAIELAKLTAILWADASGRYTLLAIGLAAVWVAARWKRLSHY